MAMTKPSLSGLVGKYAFERSENVDEYLASLGCGIVVRKVQSVTRPTLEIGFNPVTQQWKIVLESIFHKHELEFKLGEPVDRDETFDLRRCRTTVVKDDQSNGGAALLMTQIPEEGLRVTTRIKKLPNGSVQFEMECDGKKASQVFTAPGQKTETETTPEDIENGNVNQVCNTAEES